MWEKEGFDCTVFSGSLDVMFKLMDVPKLRYELSRDLYDQVFCSCDLIIQNSRRMKEYEATQLDQTHA